MLMARLALVLVDNGSGHVDVSTNCINPEMHCLLKESVENDAYGIWLLGVHIVQVQGCNSELGSAHSSDSGPGLFLLATADEGEPMAIDPYVISHIA